jgi:hypothetical protein
MPTKLADRVAELERDVQALKQAMNEHLPKDAKLTDAQPMPAKDSWRRTVGVFKDDQMFDDVVRFCKAYRRRQPRR